MADTTTILTGNLTDNPELHLTPNGTAVANFRVAVTPRIREGNDWKDGETSFYRVNAWRQLAENATESLSKGDRVIVVGRLKARSWETPRASAARS
jgi:single-strand DNA-binding protein